MTIKDLQKKLNTSLNLINIGLEFSYSKGYKENHTHVKFFMMGFPIIVSKQLFIEYFPDLHGSSSRMYLIRVKKEL